MLNYFIVFLAIFGFCHALTEEDIKKEMIKLIMQCNQKAKIELSELLPLQSFVVPTNYKVKCLLACAYKQSQMVIDNSVPVCAGYDIILPSLIRLQNVVILVISLNDPDLPTSDIGDPRSAVDKNGLTSSLGKQMPSKVEFMMTADGLYSLDRAYKIAEMVKNGDDTRMANGKKMADICVKVNDVKVSDQNKGCERAALIFKCVVENSKKFGFKL